MYEYSSFDSILEIPIYISNSFEVYTINYDSVAKKLLDRYYEINRNLKAYDMPVNAFKWKHFVGEIILQTVRWYLKNPFSYSNSRSDRKHMQLTGLYI